MYQVINPATGDLLAEYPNNTDAEIHNAVERSHKAFLSWRDTPVFERARLVERAATIFSERSEELASIVTKEMGKRIEEGKGEIYVVSEIFRYYAKKGPEQIADEPLEVDGGEAIIQKRPIGPLIGVMPWNFPYYQVARFAAPNLVLGNTILLKHARNCPESAAAIEAVLHDAGIPADAYINLYATADQVSEMLADPRIQGVSLTGSERAGSAVAMEAGRNLKKVVLELGGSDPLVLLDTSDLDKSVETIVAARMGNNGQACNAPKRIIVMEDIYDEFVVKITERMSAFEPGDPADPNTTLGPLSSQNAATELIEQIEDAVAKGATLHTGGRHIDGPGAFVEPAVLTGVSAGMRAHYEELFGPAVIVYKAADEDEAISLANDSVFGLGSSVFSDNLERARSVGDRIEAGMVYINAAGGSQPDVPFGGIKRSGVGRELGALGMEEFMNKKIVRI